MIRCVRTMVVALVAVLGGVLLAGCGASSSDRPQVVATTNILGDVVDRLVGDQAEVTTLMKPNADPHSFAISAREANTMRTAGVIIYNGLGLEEGIEQHVTAAKDDGVPVVEVGAKVRPIEYRTGDAAGALDPHFWTDPTRMVTAVTVIAESLREVDGIDAARLQRRADAYIAELNKLDGELAADFAAIPEAKRKLVTNHHVFGYFAQRYGFTVVGAIIPGGTTLASPSSSDLASLASAVRDSQVPAIFVDTSQPDRLAKALAAETGRSIAIVPLYSESLDNPGSEADSYVKLMHTNGSRIAKALVS